MARTAFGARSATTSAIHSAPSTLMWVSLWERSAPRAPKKERSTSLPWPSAIHTTCRELWSTTTVMYFCPRR